MKHKRILVTGGAGSVGSELTRQLAPENEIYILDLNETAFFDLYEELRLEGAPIRGQVGDINNLYTIEHIFSIFKPEIVFHCAALKHVTPSEHNPVPAIETNAVATGRLTEAAHRHNVEKFIFISSDKAVNDTQIYGLTKRLGELINKNAGYITVRFGNVLGSRGSVLEIWEKQIKQGKPITITDERMERYIMSLKEACVLLIEAAEHSKSGEIMIMDMGERKNIMQIAKEFLISKGLPDYPIKLIGIRRGEVLVEELMTYEEKKHAIRQGNFWIIK